MIIIQGIRPSLLSSSVVTLGMFDGVHRGHQALLHACRAEADRLGEPAVALTYFPHPSRVLRPEHAVRLLTPQAEKLERLALHRMDYTVVADFTPEFSMISADAFLAEILLPALHPRVVVAGYRTTFGHGRAGTAAVLREASEEYGFTAVVVDPIDIDGGAVSSTRIRGALDAGDVALAAELLGYRYRLVGEVMRGDGRGRTLGFPTANLRLPDEKLVPKTGVYAVQVCSHVRRYGVMHIGARPTFDRPLSVEVHLLDFDGDLYGKTLTVECIARLRDIRPFEDAAALIAQIHHDIADARNATSVEQATRTG